MRKRAIQQDDVAGYLLESAFLSIEIGLGGGDEQTDYERRHRRDKSRSEFDDLF